jgi:TPR repeat protein
MTETQGAAGKADAFYRRGVAHYNGDGGRRDVRRAFAAMDAAATLGSIKAHAALGSYYDYGIGVARSPKRALEHYRIAASAGNGDAQYNVAACLYGGVGTRRNYRAAVQWLRKAVRHGVSDASYLLGCCYEYGRGVTKDPTRAAKLFLAAARSGHADAHVEVGLHYDSRRPGKAVEWYRKAARLSSAAGQYNLAYCLERGRGVRTSRREAMRWYRAAAEQGHEKARVALEALKGRSAEPSSEVRAR